MLAGMRSVAGLLGAIGGAATVILAVISFLTKGSISDFLFRVGIAYLLVGGVALVFKLRQSGTPPATTTEGVAPAPDSVADDVADGFLSSLLIWGSLAVILELLGLVWGNPLDVRTDIQALGVGALIASVLGIALGWHEFLPLARQLFKSSRQCPRCGALSRGWRHEVPPLRVRLLEHRARDGLISETATAPSELSVLAKLSLGAV